MRVVSKERDWDDRARRYIKAELKRAAISYAELARRLTQEGLEETETTIGAKLNRGPLTASFFLATMKAIHREYISLNDL
jgi:hypothetical protein